MPIANALDNALDPPDVALASIEHVCERGAVTGRADGRAKAARRAGQDRMRRAAERLRAGDEPGDSQGVREATARLLERLAEQENLDVHAHGHAAYLADRVLTTPPLLMTDGKPLPSGYNNGQVRPPVER